MKRLAHIINPYINESDPSHNKIQGITFESMRIAAGEAAGTAQVELWTAQYPEDHPVIPDYLTKTPDLERSIRDIPPFQSKKKLPFIYDILHRLYVATEAEYLVFTNLDIILKPGFYAQVSKFIDQGHDALIINRRRIPDIYSSKADLPEIYEQKGKPHPGFDCFVFRRELFSKMVLGNIVVGIPFIGVTLAHNLFCYAQSPKLYDKERLTLHLGMDIMPPRDKELYWHNRREFFQKIKPALWNDLDIRKFPYANDFVLNRYLKWARNPSLFTLIMLKLDIRRLFRSGR